MNDFFLDAILQEEDDPKERARLREVWARLDDLQEAEPPSDLDRSFHRSLAFLRAAQPPTVSRGRGFLPLAAALVAGLAIGGLVAWQSQDSRPGFALPHDKLSFVLDPGPIAPRRLQAVEALGALAADPEVGRILIDVVKTDPSIDVRLGAIDALVLHRPGTEIGQGLIEVAEHAESTLVRIRLMELFVEQDTFDALPTLETLGRDPQVDALVRETAQWAHGRLSNKRQS